MADFWVGHFPGTRRTFGDPGQDDAGADAKPPSQKGHPKPDALQRSPVGGELYDHHRLSRDGCSRTHVDDFAGNRGVFAGHQRFHGVAASEVLVVPRKMHECLPDLEQSQFGEPLGAAAPDAGEPFQPGPQAHRMCGRG